MPVRKGRKVTSSGEKRMKELGHTKVVLWLDAREAQLIAASAGAAKLKVARWIRKRAFEIAEAEHRARVRTEDLDARGY